MSNKEAGQIVVITVGGEIPQGTVRTIKHHMKSLGMKGITLHIKNNVSNATELEEVLAIPTAWFFAFADPASQEGTNEILYVYT